MDDTIRRREITAEEEEDFIRYLEQRLQTTSGAARQELQQQIDLRRKTLDHMRSGSLRIWQRIPERIPGPNRE